MVTPESAESWPRGESADTKSSITASPMSPVNFIRSLFDPGSRGDPAVDPRQPSAGQRPLLPPFYVVVLGGLYGSTLALAKFGGSRGIAPVALAFWQMLLAGLVLLLVSSIRGQAPRLSWRHLRYYVISGAIGNAVPTVLAFGAAHEIGAGLTGLVYPLSPLITYGFAVALGMSKAGRAKAIGLGIGLVGALCIVAPQALAITDSAASVPLEWLLGALAIPCFLAAGNLYRSADWPPNAGPLPLAAGMLLATAVMLGPTMVLTDTVYVPSTTADWPLGVIALLSFVGYIIYFELQRIAGPVYFSQVSYSIALTTMFWGVAVFGERPPWWVWAAGALIFAGLAVVNRGRDNGVTAK